MKNPTPSVYMSRQRSVGHFVSLLSANDSQAAMASYVCPSLRGFLKRYTWNTLETSMGVYNFAELQSDLDWCRARGLKLVAMIVDKSFSGPTRNLPKGMEAYEIKNHAGTSTVVGSDNYGGYTAKRWDPAYILQFNLLTAKIGLAFDNDEAFEGIATTESATSLDLSVAQANGYTPELYRDMYINILTAAAKNMPHSQVFWFMNFLPGNQSYIGQIADAVRKVGVSMGGPDVLPNNPGLVSGTYPFYQQFKGRMNLFAQMSVPGFSQTHGDGSLMAMTEMMDYMRESLCLNYCFWMPAKKSVNSFGYTDAVPVIAAQPCINP